MDTEVRKFYKMVNEQGEISLSEAAKILKVAEDVVEEWARILDDANLITLRYPLNPLESPVAARKGFKKRVAKKKPKKAAKPEKRATGKKKKSLTKHVWRR